MRTFFIALIILTGMPLLSYAEPLTNGVTTVPGLRLTLIDESALENGVGDSNNVNRFTADARLFYCLRSEQGESGAVYGKLPRSQSFVFSLRSGSGELVPKTELGTKFSKSVDITKSATELRVRHHPIGPGGSVLGELFVPKQFFILTNQGTYTLEVRLRYWSKKAHDKYGAVESPPIRVEIEVK